MMLEELVRQLSIERLIELADAARAEVRHQTISIADTKLLKALFTQPLYDRMMAAGFQGMHALSFALRHRLSYLAVLAHLAACAGDDAVERLPKNTEADLAVDFATVARFPWTGGGPVPVFGFAPTGAYIVPSHRATCRAFDPYTIPRCTHEAEKKSPFCYLHKAEAWWYGPPAEDASTLAKMSSFYFTLANFGAYDEEALGELVSGFLRTLRSAIFTAAEVEMALGRLGFANRDELAVAGKAELRRRFLEAAHACHPDKGGEASAFVALRRGYDVLIAVLERGEGA